MIETNKIDPIDSLSQNNIDLVDPLPQNLFYIFTDIETESFSALILLQIAAIASTGERFNTYINPNCPLPRDCTNLLGFYFYRGQLWRNGQQLPAISVKQALNAFTDWISHFKAPVALVFHNGFSFDCSVLAKFLIRFNISIPENLFMVCDSLPYIRNNFKPPLVENIKLSTLAKYFKINHELAHE